MHCHHEIRAKSFVKARDWKAVKIYRLEALSGKSVMGYAETKRMIDDVKNKRITALVFARIARLARNARELDELMEFFRASGADLVAMDMSIDTSSPIGRHFFRTMSSMAQWELELITDRTKGAALSRAKRGIHVGGVAPFGFAYENKKLIPHSDEAPVLKLMFELFLEYKRKRTVANILNERGYRTKRGNKFTDSTVRRLLQEPVAKGLHIMNRKDSKNKPKPKEAWCIHKVEAVVDETVWNQVNQIISTQKRTNTRPLNLKVHLFTGYVFCVCGGRMYTRHNTLNYVCNKSCGNLIHKEDLEEVFKNELYSYSASPQNVDSYFDKLKKIINAKERELQTLKRKKNQLNEKIEQLLELHIQGQIKTESFHTYHAKPYEQLIQVEESIVELEGEILGFSTKKSSTNTIIQEAQNLYEKWDNLNHDQKRSVIETIVEKIIVDKDEIEINLYKLLPDGYLPSSLENGTDGQHTTTDVALVGGGQYPQPGEISLSHNGVLFLDELPEFKRTVLEVMRQPLEDRDVTISRAKFTVTYPCSFMLVASMNPSPSGYFNDPNSPMTSSPQEMQRYLSKISGPLLDRIDIHIEVTPVPFEKLSEERKGESSIEIRKRVTTGREIQTKRFNNFENIHYNAQNECKTDSKIL